MYCHDYDIKTVIKPVKCKIVNCSVHFIIFLEKLEKTLSNGY